jgi:hypothetical protein
LQDGFELPPELLRNVLQHVELQQRLGSCSMVCGSWRSAAAAPTPDISITLPAKTDLTLPPPHRFTSLEAWLRKHGGQASSLAAAWGGGDYAFPPMSLAPERPGMNLPCQQLGQLLTFKARDMLLLPDAAATAAAAATPDDCMHTAEASSSSAALGQTQPAPSPQFLSGLSSLTSLQLKRCSISGWAGGLAGLSLLTQLQHLQLAKDAVQIDVEVASVLSHLVQLTYLAISASAPAINASPAAALEGIEQLQQLRGYKAFRRLAEL